MVDRPRCTPPGAPRVPGIPVCRPAFGRGMVTPFGGPASGISPSGGSGPASAPGVIVTPVPAPTCVAASIFSDCFGSCTGVINGAAPGPVCGWTYIEPFGPLGGQFTFTPGVMSMDTFDADDYPIARKPLAAPLASVLGISGQFDFTEYATPPNGTTTYQVIMNNSGLTETLSVSLFGDGSIVFQAGSLVAVPTYVGTWTPNLGSHVVHFTVDGSGIPSIWIDGVLHPLTFFGNVPPSTGTYPANEITYGGGAGDVTPGSSPLRHLFLTAGVVGSEAVFCCP